MSCEKNRTNGIFPSVARQLIAMGVNAQKAHEQAYLVESSYATQQDDALHHYHRAANLEAQAHAFLTVFEDSRSSAHQHLRARLKENPVRPVENQTGDQQFRVPSLVLQCARAMQVFQSMQVEALLAFLLAREVEADDLFQVLVEDKKPLFKGQFVMSVLSRDSHPVPTHDDRARACEALGLGGSVAHLRPSWLSDDHPMMGVIGAYWRAGCEGLQQEWEREVEEKRHGIADELKEDFDFSVPTGLSAPDAFFVAHQISQSIQMKLGKRIVAVDQARHWLSLAESFDKRVKRKGGPDKISDVFRRHAAACAETLACGDDPVEVSSLIEGFAQGEQAVRDAQFALWSPICVMRALGCGVVNEDQREWGEDFLVQHADTIATCEVEAIDRDLAMAIIDVSISQAWLPSDLQKMHRLAQIVHVARQSPDAHQYLHSQITGISYGSPFDREQDGRTAGSRTDAVRLFLSAYELALHNIKALQKDGASVERIAPLYLCAIRCATELKFDHAVETLKKSVRVVPQSGLPPMEPLKLNLCKGGDAFS